MLVGVFCILLLIAVTFVAAMIWRPLVAALIFGGAVCLTFAAPFVYFGTWALFAGEPLLDTLKQVSLVLPAMQTIAGYVVVWALVALLGGAFVRAGLQHFRKMKA